MAIPDVVKDRFQTLLGAAADGDICVVEVTRKGSRSKRKAYAICHAVRQPDGGAHMTPIAEVPEADPLDLYVPPEGVKDRE